MSAPPASPTDPWSQWLLTVRDGGDAGYRDYLETVLTRAADRVLEGARLAAGMTLLDVGTGDGRIAWRALERVGPGLRIVLTDVSRPLLEHVRERAAARGLGAQCRFVEAAAERLEGIDAASVDAVTTRAVLAYVADKPAAFAELKRVLKPGGRLSISEPIFQDEAFLARVLRTRAQAATSGSDDDRFLGLLHRWKSAQFPDTAEGCAASPLASYSERDLLTLAQQAGFEELHLELHIDVHPSALTSWEAFISTSPHPLAPPLRSILEQRCSAAERELFERILRPAVESGRHPSIDRTAYLTARKPGG
jgi:arsenite methyltransferase